jgi:hypothetical protein
MVWGMISLFLLRIALPVFVGFGLRMLIERWQHNQESEVEHEPNKAQPALVWEKN